MTSGTAFCTVAASIRVSPNSMDVSHRRRCINAFVMRVMVTWDALSHGNSAHATDCISASPTSPRGAWAICAERRGGSGGRCAAPLRVAGHSTAHARGCHLPSRPCVHAAQPPRPRWNMNRQQRAADRRSWEMGDVAESGSCAAVGRFSRRAHDPRPHDQCASAPVASGQPCRQRLAWVSGLTWMTWVICLIWLSRHLSRCLASHTSTLVPIGD